MVIIDHHSTSPKSQAKTKRFYNDNPQGMISHPVELENLEKMAGRLLKYAEAVTTANVEGEIVYVEISADDESQTRLIVLVNHKLEFRRIDLETVEIEKVKGKIGVVQDVLADQIMKNLEEREQKLNQLQEDCENMSDWASSFESKASEIQSGVEFLNEVKFGIYYEKRARGSNRLNICLIN